MPISQSKKQSQMVLCCGTVFQRGKDTENISTGKKSLYNWILKHPYVVQSPIENDCLKLSIDSQVETQLFPKLLLRSLVIELHNIMVVPQE